MVTSAQGSANWFFANGGIPRPKRRRKAGLESNVFQVPSTSRKLRQDRHFIALGGLKKFPKIFVAYLKSFAKFAHSRLGELNRNPPLREQFLR
jgi:hypothetical protein